MAHNIELFFNAVQHDQIDTVEAIRISTSSDEHPIIKIMANNLIIEHYLESNNLIDAEYNLILNFNHLKIILESFNSKYEHIYSFLLCWYQSLRLRVMYNSPSTYSKLDVIDACRDLDNTKVLHGSIKSIHLYIYGLKVKALCLEELGLSDAAIIAYQEILDLGIRANELNWISSSFLPYYILKLKIIKPLLQAGSKIQYKKEIKQLLRYKKILVSSEYTKLYFEYVRYLNGASISELLKVLNKYKQHSELKQLIELYSIDKDKELLKYI